VDILGCFTALQEGDVSHFKLFRNAGSKLIVRTKYNL